MEQKNAEIPPLHTRFGLRLLQVLLIVFCLLLVRRCVTIYYDNKETNDQIKIEFFDKGYVNGMKKAKGFPAETETQFKNYALKKAYRDGYRQGWDMGREEIKQH